MYFASIIKTQSRNRTCTCRGVSANGVTEGKLVFCSTRPYVACPNPGNPRVHAYRIVQVRVIEEVIGVGAPP